VKVFETILSLLKQKTFPFEWETFALTFWLIYNFKRQKYSKYYRNDAFPLTRSKIYMDHYLEISLCQWNFTSVGWWDVHYLCVL